MIYIANNKTGEVVTKESFVVGRGSEDYELYSEKNGRFYVQYVHYYARYGFWKPSSKYRISTSKYMEMYKQRTR